MNNNLLELINEHDFYWRNIDEQRKWDEGFRREKIIKELLKEVVWEDVEPLIKEDWRKKEVLKLF
jgi:hypothetical protein